MIISIIIPVVVIAVIILIIAGLRADPGKGGNEMIKNVYIYLVLFATLMMTIGGSIAAFMAIADIVSPTPYYQSYEDFIRWGNEKPYIDGQNTNNVNLTEEELKVRYDALVKAEKDRQIANAKNNLIKSSGWIVIPLIVFIYFQRRLLKNEKN